MKKRLLSMVLALLVIVGAVPVFTHSHTAHAAEAGTVTIVMNDSYGDSWNDNAIAVYEEDTLLGNATVESGKSATWTVPYDPSQTYTFRWVRGRYSDECSFEIFIDGESCFSATKSDCSGFTADQLLYTFAFKCRHTIPAGSLVCDLCGGVCGTDFNHRIDETLVCKFCSSPCGSAAFPHDFSALDSICRVCGVECPSLDTHADEGACTVCGNEADHKWSADFVCEWCGNSCGSPGAPHDFSGHNGTCLVCGVTCTSHSYGADYLCTTCGTPRLLDADGDGYYDIGNVDALYAYAWLLNALGEYEINAELTANIVINENVLAADGSLNGDGSSFRAWTPIGKATGFTSTTVGLKGIFDGHGYTISGLYINAEGTDNFALFAVLSQGGVIRNLHVEDSYISARSWVSALAANAYGTVEDCSVVATVNASQNYAGGVVANAGSDASILRSSFDGKITGAHCVGGIVGMAQWGTKITDCYNLGSILGSSLHVGGISGGNGTITNCYNLGDVTGTYHVGGIAGRHYGTITNSYNAGTVRGTYESNGYVGAIAGSFDGGDNLSSSHYLTGGASDSTGTAQNAIGTETLGKTRADGAGEATAHAVFQPGEIAYGLGASFGQTIGTDAYPILGGATLYKGYHNSCVELYINGTPNGVKVDHNYQSGVCTLCDNPCPHTSLTDGTCTLCGATAVSVTFDADGGTGTMDALGFLQGESFSLPVSSFTPPEHYEFRAWLVNGVEMTPGTRVTVTENTTVKAVWQRIKYKLLVLKNVESEVLYLDCYTEYTIPEYDGVLPAGKVFDDWEYHFDDDTGSRMTSLNPGDIILIDCEEAALKATFKDPVTYATVRLYFGSDWAEYEDHSVEKESNYRLPAEPPSVPSGKHFVGWMERRSDTEVITNTTVTVTEDMDFYARFENCSGGEATCTSGAVCDTCYTAYTEPLGHSYSDGICTRCAEYDPSLIDGDGTYLIGTRAQLFWFASHVNSGNNTANARLTADIDLLSIRWVPICETGLYHNAYGEDLGYAGVFDGDGHVIKNFTIATNAGQNTSHGLFGTVSGTVKDLGVENVTFTFADADVRAGAIVGQLVTVHGTILGCYVKGAEILSGSRVVGGIVGAVYEGLVKNCFVVDSNVSGASGRYGYIVGDSRGDLSETDRAGMVRNCYTDASPVYGSHTGSINACLQKTDAQLAAGEVAYLLNESGESRFGQLIGTDVAPSFAGGEVYLVYCVSGYHPAYSNTNEGYTAHSYADGICTHCYAPNISGYAGGVYWIRTADELRLFAKSVNAGYVKAEAILEKDLDLTGSAWTPIGTAVNKYQGTFDGGNHTLTVALTPTDASGTGIFGFLHYASVSNITVKGSITIAASDVMYVGGIAGYVETSHITNCHSYVNISEAEGVTGHQHVGGIAGHTGLNVPDYSDRAIISRSSNHGDINLPNASQTVGGIVGCTTGRVEILSCANYGDILTGSATSYVGGILGYSNVGTLVGPRNSLNVGRVTGREGVVGAIVGGLRCYSGGTIRDNYYLDTSCAVAYGDQLRDGVTMGEADIATATAVTAAELASGKVAYLMNGDQSSLLWYQTCGTGAPAFSGETVYAVENCAGGTVYSNQNRTIGHVYAGGACSVCGEPIPEGLGDLNEDGVVDIADIVAVIDAASGTALDPEDYPGDPDLTGDGVIDIADIVAVIDIAAGAAA